MTATIPWPPVVGDQVRIQDSELVGIVVRIKGVHERRYRLAVSSEARGVSREAIAKRQRARRASRWYGLDELVPPLQAILQTDLVVVLTR
jgi:hypothetical protein